MCAMCHNCNFSTSGQMIMRCLFDAVNKSVDQNLKNHKQTHDTIQPPVTFLRKCVREIIALKSLLKQALKIVNCNKKLKLQRVRQGFDRDSIALSPLQYILDFFNSSRLAYEKGRNVTPKIHYIKKKATSKTKCKINRGYLDIRP